MDAPNPRCTTNRLKIENILDSKQLTAVLHSAKAQAPPLGAPRKFVANHLFASSPLSAVVAMEVQVGSLPTRTGLVRYTAAAPEGTAAA